MIIDNIKNASKYYSLNPELQKIFSTMLELINDEKDSAHDLGDGTRVSSITTMLRNESEGMFENHAKMVDVHFVIKGQEIIDIADLDNLKIISDKYNEEDYALYERPERWHRVCLNEGEFVIVFPGEAHCPLLSLTEDKYQIKKAIGKFHF